MIRNIITIDEDKCIGCGLCANACHEGAIGIVEGKAKLLRDDYCDGLGNCLPVCPTGAITFEQREALAYDANVAPKRLAGQEKPSECAGSKSQALRHEFHEHRNHGHHHGHPRNHLSESQLRQWPVQIQLVPIKADYFENAHLLVAADCAAYAYGNFHEAYMKNKVTIIGCPKLDTMEYSEKLTEILKENEIKSVTVVRMEVPCCGGIENAVKNALQKCGKMIPWQVVTITTNGEIAEV